jgi:hypothetical protein
MDSIRFVSDPKSMATWIEPGGGEAPTEASHEALQSLEWPMKH